MVYLTTIAVSVGALEASRLRACERPVNGDRFGCPGRSRNRPPSRERPKSHRENTRVEIPWHPGSSGSKPPQHPEPARQPAGRRCSRCPACTTTTPITAASRSRRSNPSQGRGYCPAGSQFARFSSGSRDAMDGATASLDLSLRSVPDGASVWPHRRQRSGDPVPPFFGKGVSVGGGQLGSAVGGAGDLQSAEQPACPGDGGCGVVG